MVIKEEKALIKVQIGSKELFHELTNAVKQRQKLSGIVKAKVVTDSESLVSVVTLKF